MVWKDSYYMPNNKETEGLICNSEDKKQSISKSLFFLGTGLNKVRLNLCGEVCWSLYENGWFTSSRFWRNETKSIKDFDLAYSAEMGIDFNACSKKVIFSSQGFGCANFKADKSYISHLGNFIALTRNSALLRNMTIFHLITPYILFQ